MFNRNWWLCFGCWAGIFLTCPVFAQENAAYKIEHYAMSVGRDGVTRETSYSENLYRNGSQLLYVRNVPASPNKKSSHEHRNERHLDSTLSPQLVVLKKNGEVDFTFLDLDNKIRVEVPKVEYNSVGFSGSWVDSYSLVDPAIFKKMVKKGPGPQANTIWYEQMSDKGTTRILWDEKNAIALVVEVSNKDGSMKKSSTSTLINLNASNPLFTSANTFKSKVIADYRD
jgi:hypothetical protein